MIGAAIGYWLRLPQRLVSGVMAFGAGVLISALSFELMEEAARSGGVFSTGVGFLAGGLRSSAGPGDLCTAQRNEVLGRMLLALRGTSVPSCSLRAPACRASINPIRGRNPMHSSLKIVGYLILAMMVTAIGYAGYISVKYWSVVGV